MDKSGLTKQHGPSIDRAVLFSALQQPFTILLESSRRDEFNTANYLFRDPIEVFRAYSLEEIPDIFHRIESALSRQQWIAGYIGYESGYHFEYVVQDAGKPAKLPLLTMCVYNAPTSIPAGMLDDDEYDSPAFSNLHFSISETAYRSAIDRIKNYIENGDTYQVNFTDRVEFDCSGSAVDFYRALRKKQHVPYGAFINLGETQILSFSPELFFRRHGSTITAKPMKGTAKRGKTLREDRELSDWLRNDEKNRSENLMIVDLLRNDLGRICSAGSVDVSDMYAVEKLETVLQMTSTVSGRLRDDIRYYDIFRSLFPCGSVTGAPKIRTMQIIHELEQHPRGVYCGAIGFISPHGESVFSVAIRTLVVNGNRGVMGVGSGIVYDSDPVKEYEECLLKTRFITHPLNRFDLLETILWDKEYIFLEEHFSRLRDSAEYFGYPFDRTAILTHLNIAAQKFSAGNTYRIRLLVGSDGVPRTETAVLGVKTNSDVIRIAEEHTDSSDRFLYHKTTFRELYNRYRKRADEERIADYIFLNERNEITEGCITNIFIEKNGRLYTPPLSSGTLNGIYRQHMLSTVKNAQEKILTLDDVRHADEVYICNSVRGMQKVALSE
ncbi:MAG: aminodeoxychorismate synthase component I [Bacteroidota bacterium]